MAALLGCCFLLASLQTPCKANDWPQWRGPLGTGAIELNEQSEGAPTTWSSTENIRWKCPIPGRGHSTPVVLGDKVFLTSAIPIGDPLPPRMSGRPGEHDNLAVSSKYQFVVICIDRASGAIQWQKTVLEAIPLEGGHISASLASASPVVDEQHVYAMFGSHGLYCLDHAGNLIWEKQFGQMHSKHGHGEGASPALYDNTLVVNWDHEEQSFIVALDAESGTERWRRNRNEVTSWSTPIIIEVDGKRQVVVCGTDRVRGYDLESGDTIWECGGLSANIVATPVFDAQRRILVVGSSYEIRKMIALNLVDATGDLTQSAHVIWSRIRGTPYVPSILLVNDGVYFLAHYQNVLTRVQIEDGDEAPGPMRLGDLANIYASPVSDGRHVFITDLEGTTMVITATEQPKLVSVNRLEEPVSASIAIGGAELFIRSDKHLFAIEKDN